MNFDKEHANIKLFKCCRKIFTKNIRKSVLSLSEFQTFHSKIKKCTSIYQPTNGHIISHKILLKRFKTLRHVSILSDHHQGALFLAKVMLRYSQFKFVFANEVLWQHIMLCCGAVARCASYDAHLATATATTQHDMQPQHLVCKCELNCEYRNITLARNKAPW